MEANSQDHMQPSSEDYPLRQVQTAGTITMTAEQFEKIYLSPQVGVKGDLRSTFANPTPLAILGFLLASSPLSCDLMGWRGAGGNGAATVGSYIFMGGLLQLIGGVLEFFLGNTFSFVLFSAFGKPRGFWLAFGVTSIPFYNAAGAYSSSGTNMLQGEASPEYQAAFAFWTLFMGVLCLVFTIGALRINVVLVFLLFTLTMAFTFFTGAYWSLAKGNVLVAERLVVGAGGITFVTSLGAWYLFCAQLAAALDFPIQLPVGDLSSAIKGASEKVRLKREQAV